MTPATIPDLPGATLAVLLALLPNGIVYYAPVRDATGQLVDFRFSYLNAAAQRLLGLPAQPTVSYLQQWPGSAENGAFDTYRDAFAADAPTQFEPLYLVDGHSRRLRAHATRLEEGLLVSLTEGTEQPQSGAVEAPPESLTQAQADKPGTAVREDIHYFFDQAPFGISMVRGPQLIVELLNDEAAALLGSTRASLLGKPLLEAIPTIREQGFEPTFQRVLQGETFVFEEIPVTFDRAHLGKINEGFYRVIYQPWRNETGGIIGMVTIAVEVTKQVLAQQQLQQLNQDLEARVVERTQALRQAQAATEQGREQLYQVFEQTPVAIAIMRGPNLRVELANPAVATIWGREPAQVLGRPYFEALPETASQGFEQILSTVLTTGQPFTITEAPVTLARNQTGQPAQAYVNFAFQPLRDAAGAITGLVASGTEVTEQVLARQQVQHLNQELRASNAGLEARVQARTEELQLAQAAAERQQDELARVFEQAPVAIAVYRGPQYIIELANPMVCRLWGRTTAQLIGKGLFEALPEVAGMGYEELLAGVMATGQPHVVHAMPAVHERDGRRDTVYWDFVYEPMYEADGRIYGVMVVATEVTEQVLARQQVQQLNEDLEARVTERTHQLEEQQGLLRQILAQVPAAVATLIGPEHRFAFFNDRYYALTGNRAALHQAVADVLPEVVEQGFLQLLDRVYANSEPFVGKEIAILLEQPAGPPLQHYLDFTYQPLTDRHGRVQGILVFAIDVSEQVRSRRQADTLQAAALAAMQRRAQQRQELYQIFTQAPVAILLLREPDHRIDYFNPAFEELFPPEEWAGGSLHGHTLAEVYPRLLLAGLVHLIDRVFKTGEPQVIIDMPLASLQPGSPRYVTLSYQAYLEDGHIVGVAAFAYDVSEQVLARQQVQDLNQELAAINQEMQATNEELHDTNNRLSRTNADLDTFVYTASHDLKAPISNIEGLLLALRQQLPPNALQVPLVPRLFEMMEGSVVRFQQTIGHLTDISQLQQAEAPETVDLHALIGDVRLDLAPLLAAAPVTLTVAVAGCEAVRVAPKTLRSVVYNLLSNAVKYRAPERPAQVQLRAQYTNSRLVLAVQDNGLGLSQAQQGELFGMFRRLHTHVEGSGVGLFTVKRLVDNAGGTITVESQPGVGSTFTVSLPA